MIDGDPFLDLEAKKTHTHTHCGTALLMLLMNC